MSRTLATLLITIALVGCSSEPERIEQRLSLPKTSTVSLLGIRPFGGGAGSMEHNYYLDDGQTRQRIASMTSVYPTRISFDIKKNVLQITACRATVSEQLKESALPYGTRRPVKVTLRNDIACGYKPFP